MRSIFAERSKQPINWSLNRFKDIDFSVVVK